MNNVVEMLSPPANDDIHPDPDPSETMVRLGAMVTLIADATAEQRRDLPREKFRQLAELGRMIIDIARSPAGLER